MTNKITNKKLTVKSSTKNLSVIRDYIQKTGKEAGFTKEEIGKIILAVDEACTNIIKHAYQFSPEGDIELKASVKDGYFVITVTDSGIHFNPEKIHDPNLVEYHKTKKVGGLGMFLMKKLMDKVEYKVLKNSQNRVTLSKKIN